MSQDNSRAESRVSQERRQLTWWGMVVATFLFFASLTGGLTLMVKGMPSLFLGPVLLAFVAGGWLLGILFGGLFGISVFKSTDRPSSSVIQRDAVLDLPIASPSAMSEYLLRLARLVVVDAVGGILFVVILLQTGLALNYGERNGLPTLLLFVSLLLLDFVAIVLLHEAGHILMGKAVGFRFIFAEVFGLRLVHQGSRFRIRWVGTRSEYSGCVCMVPRKESSSRWGMLLFLSGGLLVEILLAAILLPLCGWLNSPEFLHQLEAQGRQSMTAWWAMFKPRTIAQAALAPNNEIALLVSQLLLVNVWIFWTSLMPVRFGLVRSDGSWLLATLYGGSGIERLLLLGSVVTLSQEGCRPRDWDEEVLRRLLQLRDGSPLDAMAALLNYYRALDRRDLELAGRMLQEGLTSLKMGQHAQTAVMCLEGAYFEGFHQRNSVRARQLLELAPPLEREKQTRPRAEAAVLFADGHYQEASRKALDALHLCEKGTDPGGDQAEKELIAMLLDESVRLAETTTAKASDGTP